MIVTKGTAGKKFGIMDLLVVNWLLKTSLHLDTFARLNRSGDIMLIASFVGSYRQ
jgi:hypothetical protein